MAVGGRLEVTGSDGSGEVGGGPAGWYVYLMCVGCDALLELRKKAEEGGSQLTGLAPRECPLILGLVS